MGAVSGALVVASGQGGHVHASWQESLLIALAIFVLVGASVVIGLLVRHRHRHTVPVADQWRALAVMGELCPHGWQAQITLYGWGAPVPSDAPPSRVPLVELEWKQFDEESAGVAVARRVWAPTVSEALQMMVEDRRTDLTLEQIEQAAAEEGGESWWND